MWSVLVVEDDQKTREFFAESVSNCSDLSLSASVETVAEAISWLDRHADQINVLLVDLGLADGTGLDVIRYAKQVNPRIEPLVISMFGDENNVLASIEAGALGYIHKDSTLDGVAETILVMCAGASPISPMIARLILERHKDSRPTVGARDKHMTMGEVDANSPVGENLLSRREQEVLNLISRGYAFGEVAGLLNVSVHTVQSHIKRLYRKLSVNSKTEAVFVATRMGLFLP